MLAPMSTIKPTAPWAFIAVMGLTGSGKSTFVQMASDDPTVEIGHTYDSCTSDTKGYSFNHGGYNIHLIDTPGFNDTTKTEAEVLNDIASWLAASYEKKNKLKGVIYVHDISKPRMEGSAVRNLKMFRQLCGDDPLQNVILVTNFWGKVSEEDGGKRLRELETRDDFWGYMLKKGSRVERFSDKDSALSIIGSLLPVQPVVLQIQRELVEDETNLSDTAAGRIVTEELHKLEEKYRKEQESLRKEMADALARQDKEYQEILTAEKAKVERELDKVRRQREQLKADRRAQLREFDNQRQLDRIQFQIRYQQQQKAFDAKMQEIRNMTFDQAVAATRLNESKLQDEERIKLEQQITELSAKIEAMDADDLDSHEPKKEKRSRMRGTGTILLKSLKAVLPIGTIATAFGLQAAGITSPLSTSTSSLSLLSDFFNNL